MQKKEGVHSLVWVFGFVSVAFFFTTIIQYIFKLPMEIAFSNTFGKSNAAIALLFLLNTFGLLVGVFYQLMIEMHDIVKRIREQTMMFEEQNQKSTA